MVRASTLYTTLLTAALTASSPVLPRAVTELDDAAFREAQQRDASATRALSNVQIKAFDGRCLFVDALSGDFRANLTPLQLAACSSRAGTGQGFEVITKGTHNDQPGRALVVSTLTQACLSVDPRRPADTQVHLFSCGGRADGGGQVADSQLFAFAAAQEGRAMALTPQNSPGKCLVVAGDRVVLGDCNDKDNAQKFTFGGDAGKDNDRGANSSQGNKSTSSSAPARETPSAVLNIPARLVKSVTTSTPLSLPFSTSSDAVCSQKVVTTVDTVTTTMPTAYRTVSATETLSSTVNPTGTSAPGKTAVASDTGGCDSSSSGGSQNTGSTDKDGINEPAAVTACGRNIVRPMTAARLADGQHTANPTAEVPVSRGSSATLSPTAAAAANQFDATARRVLESVNVRAAADGRCLAIDPTAGDFRQNLIPVGLAACSEDPAQKFDVVTRGRHIDGADGKALLVSVLTNGCLNFDSRRPQGDTVTLFSCGGRADGEGQTTMSQLFPFSGNKTIVLQPASDDGKFCLVEDKDRLGSAGCDNQKDQVFELVEVLKSTADKLL